MKELLLDAETLYTREQLHDVLTKVCGFPADYGRNLDALYDLLTAYPAARLTLRHPEMLVAHLGNYGELVLRVLADAAAENPAFTLNVQEQAKQKPRHLPRFSFYSGLLASRTRMAGFRPEIRAIGSAAADSA